MDDNDELTPDQFINNYRISKQRDAEFEGMTPEERVRYIRRAHIMGSNLGGVLDLPPVVLAKQWKYVPLDKSFPRRVNADNLDNSDSKRLVRKLRRPKKD